MRIGLDLGHCTAAYGGIGRYVEELTRALLAQGSSADGPDELVLFTGDDEPAWLSEAVAPPGPGGRASRPRAERRQTRAGHATLRANLFLGPRLARLRIRVFHAPDTLGFPLTSGRGVARVVTVHDLIPLLLPQTVTRRHRWIRGVMLSSAARWADRLIADSQATARDLVDRFPEAAHKVRVVYLGVDPRFAPATEAAVAVVRRELGLPSAYLLYAGVISPVKNLERLIEAYATLWKESREIPPLVIAGRRGWLADGIMRRAHELGLGGSVRFCGFVPDEALPALLTGASAFLFPSRYEGFGLPVLEAMACGTPVLAGNRASLPEIAGEAAVLVDPEDPAGIADGIRNLLQDSGRRARLVQRGIAQARRFRWEETARRTMAVYREAAEQTASG